MCGETRSAVLGKIDDSATVQLSVCPVPAETAERGGSAGRGRIRPAFAKVPARQQLLPLEGAAWTAPCKERCYPRVGYYCWAPCSLPGSADGLPRDEAPTLGCLSGVEGLWMVGKGRTLHYLAAALVKVWEECANATEWDENEHCIKKYWHIWLHIVYLKQQMPISRILFYQCAGNLSTMQRNFFTLTDAEPSGIKSFVANGKERLLDVNWMDPFYCHSC